MKIKSKRFVIRHEEDWENIESQIEDLEVFAINTAYVPPITKNIPIDGSVVNCQISSDGYTIVVVWYKTFNIL